MEDEEEAAVQRGTVDGLRMRCKRGRERRHHHHHGIRSPRPELITRHDPFHAERGWAADADGDGWGGWVDFSKEVNRSA